MAVKSKKIFIPVSVMEFVTGTWTKGLSSGAHTNVKTAGAETTTIHTPIAIPRSSKAYGVKLKNVKLLYRATTANNVAITPTLYRFNAKALSDASVDNTIDTITTTNDKVLTANAKDRALTVTITSPDWDKQTSENCNYKLETAIQTAATTVLTVYGAIAEYQEEV